MKRESKVEPSSAYPQGWGQKFSQNKNVQQGPRLEFCMMVMQRANHKDWSPLSNCISRILRGHVNGARLPKENKRKKQFHTTLEINRLLFALQHLS